MGLNGHTRLLFTARSRSGSWAIRGEQLGGAVGGTIQVNVSKLSGLYDIAVLVKRPRPDLLHRIRIARVPIVWDVVDAWPQPEGNGWGREACMAWMDEEVQRINPIGIVAATKAMAEDCSRYGVPVITLPHHARPGQRVNPVREKVQVVGYEGAEHYLGQWAEWVEKECWERGWRFVVNPNSLADVDIAVAFRSASGYAARHWKSNVKLANLQGSGTPCVLTRERGYAETDRGGARWADTREELHEAFDALTPHENRRTAAAQLRSSRIELEDVAFRYREWLGRLKY